MNHHPFWDSVGFLNNEYAILEYFLERITDSLILPNYKSQVDSSCWIFNYNYDPEKYSSTYVRVEWEGEVIELQINAHVLAYLLLRGYLDPNKIVRHLCGNKCCVNPHHLELGFKSPDGFDLQNHKSNPSVRVNAVLLSVGQASEIKKLYFLDGLKIPQIQRKMALKCSRSTIRAATTFKTWGLTPIHTKFWS